MLYNTRDSLETGHLAHDTEDDGVDEADACHPDQTQQEQVSITVQLEVCGFGEEDGAYELTFFGAKTWENRNFLFPIFLSTYFKAECVEVGCCLSHLF